MCDRGSSDYGTLSRTRRGSDRSRAPSCNVPGSEPLANSTGCVSAPAPQGNEAAASDQNERGNHQSDEPRHPGCDPGRARAAYQVVVAVCEAALRVVGIPGHEPDDRGGAGCDKAEDPARPRPNGNGDRP